MEHQREQELAQARKDAKSEAKKDIVQAMNEINRQKESLAAERESFAKRVAELEGKHREEVEGLTTRNEEKLKKVKADVKQHSTMMNQLQERLM